jgi:prepilin-type N-terminal cleavage/methylation domain-containing protein
MRTKAFTLAELLVTMIISAILVLMVGFLSQIAMGSHNQIRKEGDVYTDLFDGFNLLTYSVRNASTVGVANMTKELTLVSNLTSHQYNRTFKNYNNTVFEYIDHLDHDKESIIIGGVSGLNFNFLCDKDASGNWLACTPTSRIFHITLTGTKDKEPLNLVTDVTRRN